MSAIGVLSFAIAGLLGAGIAAVSYSLLERLSLFLETLWRRRRRNFSLLLKRERPEAPRRFSLEGVYMLLPGLALLLAALVLAHIIVSPILIIAAAACVPFAIWRQRQGDILAQAQQAGALAHGFRGIFLLERSFTEALERSARSLPIGQVRYLALQVVSRYRAGMSLETSLEPLRASRQPYLRQLCLILERLEKADERAIVEALDALEGQLQRQRRLQARAKAAFALTSGTLRALQGANAAVLLWASLNPVWRDFFLSTPRRSLLFALFAALAVGGAIFFDLEILQEEGRAV